MVEDATQLAAATYRLGARVYDLVDVGPSLGQAFNLQALDSIVSHVVSEILDADIFIVGTPTYKGSYRGLFKHYDLLEPDALHAKPLMLCATGAEDGTP
ncbi:NAD(P)H-dependent oxidoreductase (plasmid) [Sinorhizobium chiapasense]|uniref:NAD(P)H-dependent oxidoreductase n=1 Tax=Sinorhizobium chiapasense TaxID=501572 RepID=A0ABZ2BPV2_9HYPH